jgi:hypothetical protein
MSNKNNINSFLNITSTEFKPSISNIKIVNKNNKHRNDIDNIQQGGKYSPTSSFNQLGGNINKDINNLVSMLTSDSHMSTILESNTSTPQLENKLKKLLNQEGGSKQLESNYDYNNSFIKSNNVQRGGDVTTLVAAAGIGTLLYSLSPESVRTNIKNFANKLIGNGNKETTEVNNTTTDMQNINSVTSSIAPNTNAYDSATSDVFTRGPVSNASANAYNSATSSMAPNTNAYNSATSSIAPNAMAYDSVTSSMAPNTTGNISTTSMMNTAGQRGGNKSYHLSNTSENINQEGGDNPALAAYRDIVKMLVKELNIKYPQGLKIAAQLQRDVKENNANVTPDKLLKLASEHFKNTRSKYEKMVK